MPVTVSCVDETKVVASGAPARRTCAPLTNPLPFTATANAPAGTDCGATLVRTGIGFQSVTALLPTAAELAELTARIVTELFVGRVPGAVYVPEALIVPVAALPPVTPFTCQVKAVFDVPVTVALKDCIAPARTFALEGETLTVTPDPEEGELEAELDEIFVAPVQPETAATAVKTMQSRGRGSMMLVIFRIE